MQTNIKDPSSIHDLYPIVVIDDEGTFGGPGTVQFLTGDQKDEAQYRQKLPDEVPFVTIEELVRAWQTLDAIKKGELAIILDGGIVQEVITDTEAMTCLRVMTINEDIDGADPNELSVIPSNDGELTRATISAKEVEMAGYDFTAIRELNEDERREYLS